MIEREIGIKTASGIMDTFVTHPQEGGPFPAVVIYMDVWGVREELLDVARRVGTVGFYCMVQNLYYRQGRIRNEYRDDKNRMISLEYLDERQKEIVRAPMRKLTDAMVVDDTASILEFLDRNEPADPGPVGAIGYCLGGRLVFRACGAFPERFRAGASLHGTRLVSDGSDSAHLGALQAQGELYCGFAEKDPWAPLSTIETIARTLENAKVRYRYQIHEGAEHGYALPDRDIHNKQAANRDWEIIFAMFKRQLVAGSAQAADSAAAGE